jgi:hypothetical protein
MTRVHVDSGLPYLGFDQIMKNKKYFKSKSNLEKFKKFKIKSLKKSIKSKSFKIKSNPNQIQVLKKFLSGE